MRWYFWAIDSRLAPMIKVAKLITRRLLYVLACFKHRITKGVAHGLKSKISTVRKHACCHRNPNQPKIVVYIHRGGSTYTRLPCPTRKSNEPE